MNKHLEDDLQKVVCTYIKLAYPKAIFNSDLSGIKLTIGQASRVKNLRSSKSFPDLMIFEPRNGYHGLFIELKKEGTKLFTRDGSVVSNEHIQRQFDMIKNLEKRGYLAAFGVGFMHTKKIIDNYLR